MVAGERYYTTRLWIGTPPQRFALIVDTGSTVTYVPCATCEMCGRHQVSSASTHSSATFTIHSDRTIVLTMGYVNISFSLDIETICCGLHLRLGSDLLAYKKKSSQTCSNHMKKYKPGKFRGKGGWS